ncbi:eukaryotic translation initiation factor-like protein, partial [Tanacetum coccineum]
RVAMLIHDNAIAEPSLYNVYAQLCSDLNDRLPSFQSDDKVIKFRGLIINKCQETFQGSDKLLEDSDLERLTRRRTIGNTCFIGELFKQNLLAVRIVHEVIKTLLSPDSKLCLEVRVEAVCQLLIIVGKKLDDTSYYGRFNDVHFNVLTKELSVDQHLSPHVRSMVLDVIDLRSNNWVPKEEKVKAKSIVEIHIEADMMNLRLGSTAASIGAMAGGAQGSLSSKGRSQKLTSRNYKVYI